MERMSPTKQARVVLADCEEALLEFTRADQWSMRRRWVTVVGLMRAVGHVVRNVDADSSPAVAAAVADQFEKLKQSKPDPTNIFWGFIEQERNNVLKTYRFAVRGNVTIGVLPAVVPRDPPPEMPPGSIGIVTDVLGSHHITSRFDIPALKDGPFAGMDPIAVIREAIAFWHAYLNEIDKEVARRQG
jgi:hypothetical protein